MKVYVSSDGDGIGSQVGKAGLNDDVEGMRRISTSIKKGNEFVVAFVIEHGGVMILEGGDETSFEIDAEFLALLPDLREKWRDTVGATLSMGVGKRLSQAGMALMAAKLRGKDRIEFWTPELEQEVLHIMQEPEEKPEDKIRDEYFKAEQGEMNLLDHLMEDEEGKEEEPDQASMKQRMDGASKEDGPPEPEMEDAHASEMVAEEEAQAERGEDGSPEAAVDEAGRSETQDMLRQIMGEALMGMKEQAPNVEALKEKNPELYAAIYQLIQATTEMAGAVLGEDPAAEEQGEEQPEEGQEDEKDQPPVDNQLPAK